MFERQKGQSKLAQDGHHRIIEMSQVFRIQQATNNYSTACATYAAGIKAVLNDITLRVLVSRLEKAGGKSIRARALLEKAGLVNPKSDVLWAEAVRVEERSGAPTQGNVLLAHKNREPEDCVVASSRSIGLYPTQ